MLEDLLDRERENNRQHIKELKYKYQTEIDQVKEQFEKQQMALKLQKLEIEHQKQQIGYEISSLDESHASEFSVKMSELNDKFLNVNQMYEEAVRTIHKQNDQIVKLKCEHEDELTAKDNIITKLEKRIVDISKRLENQDKKTKQICALQCKMLKLEASKRKAEDELKRSQANLETERIMKRKKKINDKSEKQKVNEVTMKLTRNIENLKRKIKQLQTENMEISAKLVSKEKLRHSTKNTFKMKTSRNNQISNTKPGMNHSQSNDTLLKLKSPQFVKNKNSVVKNRDLSELKRSNNNTLGLNLSEITDGSPASTYRGFNH